MGSGLIPGNSGSTFAANLHVIHSETSKNIGEDCRARAVHRVDGKLEPRFRNEVEIGEALDGLQIGGQKVVLLDRRGRGGVGARGWPR